MPIKSPFQVAERYIQLRRKCASPSWLDTGMRFNEMVLAPIVTIFCLITGGMDLFSVLSSCMTIFTAWSEWIEYQDLRAQVQVMFLQTMATGGPRIVTNDPEYMPYVYADAVVRLHERHPRP